MRSTWPLTSEVLGVTVYWSDAALERSGMTREQAVLALANQLLDIGERVHSVPPDPDDALDWADTVVLNAPTRKATRVVHTQLLVNRYHDMWRRMFRDS